METKRCRPNTVVSNSVSEGKIRSLSGFPSPGTPPQSWAHCYLTCKPFPLKKDLVLNYEAYLLTQVPVKGIQRLLTMRKQKYFLYSPLWPHQALVRMWSNRDSHTMLVERAMVQVLLKSSAASYKTKHTPTICSSHSTPRYLSKRNEVCVPTETYMTVFC